MTEHYRGSGGADRAMGCMVAIAFTLFVFVLGFALGLFVS